MLIKEMVQYIQEFTGMSRGIILSLLSMTERTLEKLEASDVIDRPDKSDRIDKLYRIVKRIEKLYAPGSATLYLLNEPIYPENEDLTLSYVILSDRTYDINTLVDLAVQEYLKD